MPMIKIGASYYNGSERPIYLIQGNAVRDGEDAPVKGKAHAKVSVAAAQRKDESTLFVTVNGWRDRAEEVAAVRKMDSVLAIGILKKREYNGNYYYDLDADFIAISGVTGGISYGGSNSVPAYPASEPEFAELPDAEDGELPF